MPKTSSRYESVNYRSKVNTNISKQKLSVAVWIISIYVKCIICKYAFFQVTINKRDKLAVVKDKLRSMSLLQISPLPRETHSTSNKFNKPTHPQNLSRIYNDTSQYLSFNVCLNVSLSQCNFLSMYFSLSFSLSQSLSISLSMSLSISLNT